MPRMAVDIVNIVLMNLWRALSTGLELYPRPFSIYSFCTSTPNSFVADWTKTYCWINDLSETSMD